MDRNSKLKTILLYVLIGLGIVALFTNGFLLVIGGLTAKLSIWSIAGTVGGAILIILAIRVGVWLIRNVSEGKTVGK